MKTRNGRDISILGASVAATLLAAVVAMAAAPMGGGTASPAAEAVNQNGPTILETYKGHFLIGTAGDPPGGFSDQELNLIKQNFNCITPENYLKPGPVHPLEDVWSFKRPDALIKWCNENNIAVHGHTLAWHSQTNGWFFQGGDKEVVSKRLHDHITTLVGRYKGKMHSWDVVNEAINDGGGRGTPVGDPAENLRSSQWVQIIGPEFLTLAFKWAHEADPDAKLFYNDYNIESGAKHQNSMALLKRLIKDGAPIYGVGIQGHWSTNGTPYVALDKAISDYASLGLKVSISELDVTIAGATGGQLPGAGGGGARRGRGAGGPATAPAGAMLSTDDDGMYFVAAPPPPAAPAAGRGGAGRGGRGGGGRGGATPPPVNPVSTVQGAVSDLSADEQAKLGSLSDSVGVKLAEWQKTSQAALLSVQPQYSAGQVAYAHEAEEFAAEQTVQNGLRDAIINDAEVSIDAILTPAQVEKWQTARLDAQFTSQFGALGITDAQKSKADALIAASAKKLASAKTSAAVADAKAEFSKSILALLDDTQVQQYQASRSGVAGGAGRGRRGGRGGQVATAAGLKAQADAYARLFSIFEKHRETMDRVTVWGLNDARSWRAPQSAVWFDANNMRKPAYLAIVDALAHPRMDWMPAASSAPESAP